MPRPRRPENEGLPSRWQLSHGAYFYQVPPGLEYLWDHKKKYRLGATFDEAMAEFLRRAQNPAAAEGIGLDRLLPVAEIIERSTPLPKSGVYFLIEAGNVVYVGRSDSIAERIATHVRRGLIQFSATFAIPAVGLEMERLEQLYIGQLKPQHNICFLTSQPN